MLTRVPQIGDPTAKGKTCDDANDANGCINTENLLTPAVSAAQIKAAVANIAAPAAAASGSAAAAATGSAAAASASGAAASGMSLLLPCTCYLSIILTFKDAVQPLALRQLRLQEVLKALLPPLMPPPPPRPRLATTSRPSPEPSVVPHPPSSALLATAPSPSTARPS